MSTTERAALLQHNRFVKTFRGALAMSFGASTGIQLLTIVTGIVLARSLGPGGRGELAALVLWPAVIAAVGALGVPDAVTFQTARAAAPVGTIAGTTLAVAVVQSAVLVGIGAAIVPFVFSGYGNAMPLAYASLSFIPLNLVTLCAMGVLNGLGRTRAYQALRVAVVLNIATAFVVFSIVGTLSVGRALFVQLGSNLIVAVAATTLVLRERDVPLRVDLDVARRIVSFGLRTHLHGVSTLLNERLDQLMISLLLAPASLGLYVIAVTLTSATSLVGSSVAFVALPEVAQLRERDQQLAATRRYLRITVALAVLVTVPLVVLAPRLIELFFGSAFAPVGNVCRILLAAGVLLSVSRALAALLTALNRPLDAGLAESCGLVVTAVALGVLLPAFGLMGAAVASLIAYTVTLGWMVRRTARVLDTPVASLLLPAERAPRSMPVPEVRI
jgi:O-antigen/teichoic acid export membrane protein